MQLQEALSTLSIWCVVMPLLTGCRYFRMLNADSRIIVGVVALAAIPQLLRAYIDSGALLNVTYNLYTPLEVVLLYSLFSKRIVQRNRRRIFIVTAVFSCMSYFMLTAWYGISSRFINEAVSINDLIYTGWALLVILEQYEVDEGGINIRTPFFWYLTGLILYAPCTMLVFSLWRYIRLHPDAVIANIWIIQSIFNITMYLLFTIGILMDHEEGSRKNPTTDYE
ncbi:MAG TPA: hypothetical protein VM802_20305 [Chitinophaga sp.]|uniref:hypothetical protein n=1 Tax=Chitinophaga sp. TaxID=1869181 RepID=UPI002C0F6A59|nr:hypothetical protein [Chitinophaga sp.]HVI47232.1 hypothetical protein [Chitinophaga sp.]